MGVCNMCDENKEPFSEIEIEWSNEEKKTLINIFSTLDTLMLEFEEDGDARKIMAIREIHFKMQKLNFGIFLNDLKSGKLKEMIIKKNNKLFRGDKHMFSIFTGLLIIQFLLLFLLYQGLEPGLPLSSKLLRLSISIANVIFCSYLWVKNAFRGRQENKELLKIRREEENENKN